MSGNKFDSAILDLGDDEGVTHSFGKNVPDSALDQDDEFIGDDTDELLGEGNGQKALKSYSFWSMEFYQQFFDVDTDDVLRRLLWSVLPRPGKTVTFFKTKIRTKPDLYGPLWICVTLIFAMAISGNIASYLRTETSFKWHYNFHTVTIVSSAVFGYAWIVPSILFVSIWWLGAKGQDGEAASGKLSFLELLCTYGYSMAVFIPISVLWIIQISIVQWILVAIAFALSGGVLGLTLGPELTKKAPKFGSVLLVAVVGLHLLLACTFMLCFFHAPASTQVQPVINGTSSTNSSTGHVNLGQKTDMPKTKREDQSNLTAIRSSDEGKIGPDVVESTKSDLSGTKIKSESDIEITLGPSSQSKNLTVGQHQSA